MLIEAKSLPRTGWSHTARRVEKEMVEAAMVTVEVVVEAEVESQEPWHNCGTRRTCCYPCSCSSENN